MYDVIIFTDGPGSHQFSRGNGAYRIATECRNNGYSVLVIDFCSALSWNNFTEIIDSSLGDNTKVVAFSTTWFPYKNNVHKTNYFMGPNSLNDHNPDQINPNHYLWYKNSISYEVTNNKIKKYVDYIKKNNNSTKVVVGGAKSFQHIDDNIDHVFIGYSENQFIDFLQKNQKFPKIINYDVKAHFGNFDFSKSKTSYVENNFLDAEEVLAIEFSRGCIFNCSFCSYPHRNQNTKNYTKYQDVIYKELTENWVKWQSYKYVITDDTFNDYTIKLELIKEVIQSLSFKPVFWSYIRKDLIFKHPIQAELIKDIGVKITYYGLDTFHDNTAKIIKKGGTINNKLNGIKMSRDIWGNEIYTTAGIVIGLPEDTVESINQSANWYINEGYKYLNQLNYFSLSLRDFGQMNKYLFQSDIEKNMSMYGYNMISSNDWIRSDNGDIKSKTQADSLMIDFNKKIEPYKSLTSKKGNRWWDTVFKKHYGPNLDNFTYPELYYRFANEYYYYNLKKYLKII